ncbi:MAG: NADH-quinone oxidoreductase subunit C [Chloroflexi bacterium]|nr:NADH-quinone oxidoreductase subunit C [Chloroflexota bacterium]
MTSQEPRRPAHQGRSEPETPVAPARLDRKGEALAALLPRVLESFGPAIGADIDEVTCKVPRDSVRDACQVLKSDPRMAFDYLRLLTVVDYLEASHELEVVYHLYSLPVRHKMVLKARVPEADPWIPSVTSVWRGANWYEREMRDLFGVDFRGHPDLRRLILPDDFEGHPGRKSYPLYEYDEY